MIKINIAIDGHSSCGKSTIAKGLANNLNYIYIDSGSMYRAVTYFALQGEMNEFEQVKEAELLQSLSKIQIGFKEVDGEQHTLLNGEDIEFQIRGIEVSKHVSQVARIPAVRKHLVIQQKKLGENKGVVMDGRDIGTVVFPGAEVKFYVTADAAVRAKRRFDEMKSKGYDDISLEMIKQNIEERDFMDTHRKVSPLIQAIDAILLDTSNLTQSEQLGMAIDIVNTKLVALGN
jgi:cytidylate kinase